MGKCFFLPDLVSHRSWRSLLDYLIASLMVDLKPPSTETTKKSAKSSSSSPEEEYQNLLHTSFKLMLSADNLIGGHIAARTLLENHIGEAKRLKFLSIFWKSDYAHAVRARAYMIAASVVKGMSSDDEKKRARIMDECREVVPLLLVGVNDSEADVRRAAISALMAVANLQYTVCMHYVCVCALYFCVCIMFVCVHYVCVCALCLCVCTILVCVHYICVCALYLCVCIIFVYALYFCATVYCIYVEFNISSHIHTHTQTHVSG